MNSPGNLKLNAQTVVKRPATKHAFNAIQRSFPSWSGAPSSQPKSGIFRCLYRNYMTNPKPTSVSVLISRSAN